MRDKIQDTTGNVFEVTEQHYTDAQAATLHAMRKMWEADKRLEIMQAEASQARREYEGKAHHEENIRRKFRDSVINNISRTGSLT